jgi:hypothetical protein
LPQFGNWHRYELTSLRYRGMLDLGKIRYEDDCKDQRYWAKVRAFKAIKNVNDIKKPLLYAFVQVKVRMLGLVPRKPLLYASRERLG